MNNLKYMETYLQEKNLQAMLITSPDNIAKITGFNCEPYERFLAVLFSLNSAPILFVPSLDLESAQNASLVRDIIPIFDHIPLCEQLKKIIDDRKIVITNLGIEFIHLTYEKVTNLNQIFTHINYIAVDKYLQSLRMVKSNQELKKLKEAARLADYAIKVGIESVTVGKTESEIVAEIEYRLKKEGIDKMSFATMVLTGENTSLPHGKPGNTKIENGDFLLFDLGVVVDGYCSDITRTVAVGNCSSLQKEVYQTVLNAQLLACNTVKPNLEASAIDFVARQFISEAGYEKYFTHRLGHGIGLSVHEFPDISQTSSTVLQTGMTFTIEPGIYLPKEFGVRIEDVIYISDSGTELLTKFPKELIYI